MRKLITPLFFTIVVFSVIGVRAASKWNIWLTRNWAMPKVCILAIHQPAVPLSLLSFPMSTYYALYGTTVGNVFTIKGMITGQFAGSLPLAI